MSSLWNRGGPQGQHQITSSQVYPQLPSSNNQFQQQHYQQQSQAMQPYNGNQSVAGPSYGNQQGGPQPQGTVGSYNSSSVGYQPGVVWTQVPIQPLEARAADEDPLYGSLARAKGKVDRAMKSDEDISPDLTTKGQGQNDNDNYLPEQHPALRPIKVARSVNLPDALNQQFTSKNISAKMGLFEEIGRAWLVVDNKLFLWDYSDGRDFSRYDEQAEDITIVGLIKVRPDVFIDELSHLLVICTKSKISVLGLGRAADSNAISLFTTNLATDAPTAMTHVAGTSTGRIFMRGIDKNLYELDYSNNSKWFFSSGAKVWVINRSSSAWSNWMPSVMSSSDNVQQIVIDSSRARLYVLRDQGSIEMVDIGESAGEKRFNSLSRYDSLAHELKSRNFAGQAPYAGGKIVSIAVIARHESVSRCLIAMAANGTRVYFTLNLGKIIPTIFRPAPTTNSGISFSSFSMYSSGMTIGIQLNQPDSNASTPSSTLHFFTPEVGEIAIARETHNGVPPQTTLHEFYSAEIVDREVQAVVEISATHPGNSPFSFRTPPPAELILNPLATQAVTGQRTFLVLTSSAIHYVAQPRPVDIVRLAMETDKEGGYVQTASVFGRTQITAMGLDLGAQADLARQNEMAAIVSHIVLQGGAPKVIDDHRGRHIYYSAKHDGLALILSRLLRPIWNANVTAMLQSGSQVLAVSPATLLDVRSRLEKLRAFTDENPFPVPRAEGISKTAWDQEEFSVDGLLKLLKHAIEAISFVLLLHDYKLPEIVFKCDPAIRQRLASVKYYQLLTDSSTRDIAKSLVTAMIEQQIGQEQGIDSLSETLQDRCGSFCQPGDVVLYKAEESLRRAEGSRTASERSAHLGEALQFYNRASANLPIGQLRSIAGRFSSQGYVPGATELPLNSAHAIDPANRALEYALSPKYDNDPRKPLYESRRQCYEIVIQELQKRDEALDAAAAEGNQNAVVPKRDEAYSIAIASDDELFHYYLYDWQVKAGRAEQLLDYDTPYIESYLRDTGSGIVECRDLLWKFYQRRDEYMHAAHALNDLATSDNDIDLQQRSYYLAQALTSAKSAGDLHADDVDFVTELQEQLDVSYVQLQVAHAIEVHPDIDQETKYAALGELNKRILTLDRLYENFARPYRLFEQILLIIKTADTALNDVVEMVWRQLLQQAPGTPKSEAMATAITDLCRKYFPSEAAPLEIVLWAVYEEAATLLGESKEGWATRALLNGGVPIRECFEALIQLTDSARTENEREFYTDEAGWIAEEWVKDPESIHLADVEKYVSANLLRLSAGELDERQMRTKERLAKAKHATRRR